MAAPHVDMVPHYAPIHLNISFNVCAASKWTETERRTLCKNILNLEYLPQLDRYPILLHFGRR